MTASQTLQSAAELVAAWPKPYAAPLAELLVAEARHAADLERQSDEAGWDRYPPGSCLVALAQGVLDDDASRRAVPRGAPMAHPPVPPPNPNGTPT